jgi:hypothetical protein
MPRALLGLGQRFEKRSSYLDGGMRLRIFGVLELSFSMKRLRMAASGATETSPGERMREMDLRDKTKRTKPLEQEASLPRGRATKILRTRTLQDQCGYLARRFSAHQVVPSRL